MSTTIGVFDMFKPDRPIIATHDPLRSPPPSWWSSQLEDMYEHKLRFPDVEVPGWDMALASPPSPSRRTMEMLPGMDEGDIDDNNPIISPSRRPLAALPDDTDTEMDEDDIDESIPPITPSRRSLAALPNDTDTEMYEGDIDDCTPPVSPSRRSLAALPDDTDTEWRSDMDVCPQLSPPSPIQRQSPLPTLESELDTPQTTLFIEEDTCHPSPAPPLYTHMHTSSPLADRLRNEYTALTSLRDRTLHAERTSRARNVALRGRERELGRAVAALRDAAANTNTNANTNTDINTSTTILDSDTPLTSLPASSASLHAYRTLATRVMLERTEEKRRRKKDKERVKELRVILGVGVGALIGLMGDVCIGTDMGMGMEAYDGVKLMDGARGDEDAKVPIQMPSSEAMGTTVTMCLGIEEDAKVPMPMPISKTVETTMGLGIETTRMDDDVPLRYIPCDDVSAFATGFGRTTTTTSTSTADLGIENNPTHLPDGLVAESSCAEQSQRSRLCLGGMREYMMGAETVAHGHGGERVVDLALSEREGEGRPMATTATMTAGMPGQGRVPPLPAMPPPPTPVSESGLSGYCVDNKPTTMAESMSGNAPGRFLPPSPLPLPPVPTLHCDAEAINGMFGSNLGLGTRERGEEGVMMTQAMQRIMVPDEALQQLSMPIPTSTISNLPTLQTLPAFPAPGSQPSAPPSLIPETQHQPEHQQQQLYPYSYPPASAFTSTPTPGLGLCLSFPFSLPLPMPLGSPSSPHTPYTPHTALTERTMAMRRLVARMTMRRRDLGMRSLVEAVGAMEGESAAVKEITRNGGERDDECTGLYGEGKKDGDSGGGGGGVKSLVHVGGSQQRKRAKSALGREVVVAEDLEDEV